MNHHDHDVEQEQRQDGSILLRSRLPIGPIARNTGEWLHRWAAEAPDRPAIAERPPAERPPAERPPAERSIAERNAPAWRELRYGELLQQVRTVAASLLDRNLTPDRPILILSGNGIDHLVLTLAGQYIGIPAISFAEQYSLVPEAEPRLVHAAETAHPGLVFADDPIRYARALALPCLAAAQKLTTLADLRGDSANLDAAHAKVGPDTVAKIIFTSGSTANPKGVVTTHRMLCVNQAQILAAMPFLAARPHRIVDWLPWNHVFGGSHDVNMMLANGGTLYIDDGKPTRTGLAATIRNIKDVRPTLAFNVPLGFSQLVAAMRDDQDLKRAYLADCDLIFYAAASVPPDIWDALRSFAAEVRGQIPPMYSGWGMTETAPSCLQSHQPDMPPGNIGVPLPLVTVKLVPDSDGRCDLRVAGPNILPAYFEDPVNTAAAFDTEGFFITGDAVRFADPRDPNAGLLFDGRIAEDFKLSSGTWVRATNIRLAALQHFADIAQDVVVTGHDREEIGILIFPHPSQTPHDQHDGAVTTQLLRTAVADRLRSAATHATGSSTRIVRALILAAPPSVSDGELTAKGSMNARRVLTLRKPMLDRLYSPDDPAVIRLERLP